MRELSDAELLSAYANDRLESAFAVLVERYIALVYSAARRQVRSAELAEEVTQAVFVILAQKARSLSRRAVLSGWLCRAAHLTARNAERIEARRQRREQEAYMQSCDDQSETNAELWVQVAPLLDEAVAQLGESDRNAVVMRFYEQKPLREVGDALGIDADAAQKRVARAVEKLRKFLGRRGVAYPASAIGLAIQTNSVHAAPAGLAPAAVAAATAKGGLSAGSIAALVKAALKWMLWSQAKVGIVLAGGVLLAAGATTIVVQETGGATKVEKPATNPKKLRMYDRRVLDAAPPQVSIVSVNEPANGGYGSSNGKIMGIRQRALYVVKAAYNFNQMSTRVIVSAELPKGTYDFIASLPDGNEKALQQEVRRVFGVVARRQTIVTNILLLKVAGSNGPALQPGVYQNVELREEPGRFSSQSVSFFTLVQFLEAYFKTPVFDRTGLEGDFDIDLKWDEKRGEHGTLQNPEGLKQALLDQLGVQLVPAREPVEMMIIERAPNTTAVSGAVSNPPASTIIK
jgi:uncharacterized protein (TIGR03435 family)